MLIQDNLAPQGAIVKLYAMPVGTRRFVGPCRVFEDEDCAIAGLGDGTVNRGDAIVLRMPGPIGGPGTVFAASFMAALAARHFASSSR